MDADPEKASIRAPGAQSSFAPIRHEGLSATTSRRSSTARDVTRTVSQNGYGVSDEAVAGRSTDDEEAQTAVPEKDPFEVGWDNGDNDPLCPRSFTNAKKWLIVIIVSGASFCV